VSWSNRALISALGWILNEDLADLGADREYGPVEQTEPAHQRTGQWLGPGDGVDPQVRGSGREFGQLIELGGHHSGGAKVGAQGALGVDDGDLLVGADDLALPGEALEDRLFRVRNLGLDYGTHERLGLDKPDHGRWLERLDGLRFLL
jgi:hypothetical protein